MSRKRHAGNVWKKAALHISEKLGVKLCAASSARHLKWLMCITSGVYASKLCDAIMDKLVA